MMAFGSFDNKNSGSAVSEINMVPLIDVMLVLLVIFIITAPLLSHSIKINVPQASSEPVQQDPKVVDFAVDAEGGLFRLSWGGPTLPNRQKPRNVRSSNLPEMRQTGMRPSRVTRGRPRIFARTS